MIDIARRSSGRAPRVYCFRVERCHISIYEWKGVGTRIICSYINIRALKGLVDKPGTGSYAASVSIFIVLLNAPRKLYYSESRWE